MTAAPRRRLPALALVLLLPLAGWTSCESFRFPVFLSPLPGLLSLDADATQVELLLPLLGRVDRVELRLDGAPVLDVAGGGLVLDGKIARGELAPLAAGRYELEAVARVRFLWLFSIPVRNRIAIERIALDRPDECEVLNDVECLLPFPSARYLERADTATGFRVVYPDGVMPVLGGSSISSAEFSGQDGFSPAAQVLVHFPGGVDPALSGASRLLPDTRTYGDAWRHPDSPTLLLDATDGMRRVPHWIETDARTAAGSDRQVVFLRPAEGLVPGHRYIVAFRNLVHADGSPVEAEPVFAALRDRHPSSIPAVRDRRGRAENIFWLLRRAHVRRDDLVLAFDFVVQSQEDLTREVLAMRDRSFDWLAAQTEPTFTVFPIAGPDDEPDGDVSLENDCAEPDQRVWRRLRGTFETPLFLSADPLLQSVVGSRLVDDDGDGLPDLQGTMDANFAIDVPCSVLAPGAPKLPPILLGHGLFGNGRQSVGIAQAIGERRVANGGNDFLRIGGATDWLGLSSFDFDFSSILAPSFILQAVLFDPGNFGTLPDRLRQGMTNTLVLGRMMKEGRFNADPAFQTPDGEGVFPGPDEALDYFGISLGGIMGTQFAALSPDAERVSLDVPASNFSILIQRSSAIGLISLALNLLNPDPMVQAVFFAMAEESWDSAEAAGYLRNLTRNPLPGSGPPKDLLVTLARFDGVVSNEASEIYARTLGLPNLRDTATPAGSAVAELPGIPDVAGPFAEGAPGFVGAMIWYDLGMYDLADPAHAPFIPPLANLAASSSCDPHGQSFSTGAVAEQIGSWLDTGVIANTCDGLCDGLATGGGFQPFELPNDRTEPCDPLAASNPFPF